MIPNTFALVVQWIGYSPPKGKMPVRLRPRAQNESPSFVYESRAGEHDVPESKPR